MLYVRWPQWPLHIAENCRFNIGIKLLKHKILAANIYRHQNILCALAQFYAALSCNFPNDL